MNKNGNEALTDVHASMDLKKGMTLNVSLNRSQWIRKKSYACDAVLLEFNELQNNYVIMEAIYSVGEQVEDTRVEELFGTNFSGTRRRTLLEGLNILGNYEEW